MKKYLSLIGFSVLVCLASCKEDTAPSTTAKSETKHHLNIPDKGIESLMEANSQKIIEGTDGSVLIQIGNVTRKEADITVKIEDKILEEKMVSEEEDLHFSYEGNTYTLHVGKIKKPLIGEGKVNIKIQ